MVQLGRIILYVQDAERLSVFYREAFAFEVVQHIPGEWVVLKAGECELALFQVGPEYRSPPGGWRGDNNNAKLVFTIDRPMTEMRDAMIALGVDMGAIKKYPPLTGELCDGRDPEGNVFQLSEAMHKS